MVRAVATAQYILEFRAWSCNQVDARFSTGPLDLVEYAIREVRHDNVWLMFFFFTHVNVAEGQDIKQIVRDGIDGIRDFICGSSLLFVFGCQIFPPLIGRFIR